MLSDCSVLCMMLEGGKRAGGVGKWQKSKGGENVESGKEMGLQRGKLGPEEGLEYHEKEFRLYCIDH